MEISANSLLQPSNRLLLLIDHQYLQLLMLRSHEQELNKPFQDQFPDQKPLDLSTVNTWEDQRLIDWVEITGKRKLVMAGV